MKDKIYIMKIRESKNFTVSGLLFLLLFSGSYAMEPFNAHDKLEKILNQHQLQRSDENPEMWTFKRPSSHTSEVADTDEQAQPLVSDSRNKK